MGVAPEGIDVVRVTAWFCEHLEDVTAPLTFTLIAGGRSNLTYRVEDAGGRTFCLRRPPVSHVLPTAHDMVREHRVMTALGSTDVPVPRTLGLCTDETVNQHPFYVMEYVDGHILRDQASAEAAFDEGQRAGIGDHMADTLARLHAVDIDRVGLGDLGPREGYVERQLRRWTEQYRKMRPSTDGGEDLVEQVAASLAASVPPQRTTAIVHGDYRLDNVVLDDSGSVRAILDWEICTLGDPLADVGLLMVYWADQDDPFAVLGAAPTLAKGFSSRADVLERYAEASGADVSSIGYYTAFGYWKLACILQGVFTRYAAGAGAGDRSSVGDFPRIVTRLAETAASSLAAR